jgi:hypothetical protein
MPIPKRLPILAVCSARVAGPTALLAVALVYLWSSLATIANFAFRYPAFDQFRLYPIYLGLPFPENAIQIENGHRPILPALVRLAEIRWFAADQWLQIAIGLACALLALTLLIWTLSRDRGLKALQVSAGTLMAVLAIFWLGNARILMHGNELVHAYIVVLLLICMVLAIHAARTAHTNLWMGAAALCAFAATFTFGSGMACFPALFVGAFLVRTPPRALALPAVLFAGALATYVFALPGNDGIRHVISVDPAANISALLSFLASPWMNAWLGMADPPLISSIQHSALHSAIGYFVVETARAIAKPLGSQWLMRECLVVGALGVLIWSGTLLHAWRQGRELSRVRLLAIALMSFGIGVAAMVSATRMESFLAHPTGILTDRYLPWSCLFWLGSALYIGCGVQASPRRQCAFAATALFCALILIPSHRSLAGWSATVHRNVQQSAVAAQLGIWDGQRFPDGPDARKNDVLASLGLLKRAHLSMFSEPAYALLEAGWHLASRPEVPLAGAFARVVRQFDDRASQHHVAAIEGWMPRVEGFTGSDTLVVVGSSGALRGLAKPSYIGPNKRSLRFSSARKGGFDGYVLDPARGELLSVVAISAAGNAVAAIPLQIPL